jgi:hypothetical protein
MLNSSEEQQPEEQEPALTMETLASLLTSSCEAPQLTTSEDTLSLQLSDTEDQDSRSEIQAGLHEPNMVPVPTCIPIPAGTGTPLS